LSVYLERNKKCTTATWPQLSNCVSTYCKD
jgi:hypothetical protein